MLRLSLDVSCGRVVRLIAVVLAIAASASWSSPPATVLGPSSDKALAKGEAAWAELERRGEKVSLISALDEARYAARPVEGVADTVTIHNPAQMLGATFTAEGMRLRAGSAHLELRPIGIGYGDALQPMSHLAIRTEGARVEIDRGSSVTEWWVNRASGLEQGYTVHRAPEGKTNGAWLRVAMALDGDLTPHTATDGQSATFVTADGATRLTYDHLQVFDAVGQKLPARLVVVDEVLSLEADDTRAVYPITVDPTFTQQAYLKASNPGISREFGSSVTVSGNTVAVGAPGEAGSGVGVNPPTNDDAANAGAAYVFVRSGGVWTQQAYLKASNAGADDLFGHSVAISGDTLVVGAHGEDGSGMGVDPVSDENASGAGAAYVFVRSGGVWTQQAYLKASNSGSNDVFGYSVAVSGDTVVVGAHSEAGSGTGVDPVSNDGAAHAGAAYVFSRDGTTWTQQVYLKSHSTRVMDLFGHAVAVSGDTVVVGAWGDDGNGTGVNPAVNDVVPNSGAAYVFVRSGTLWSQQAYLKASSVGPDWFGFSVAVSGDTVVVGAILESGSGTGIDPAVDDLAQSAGAAYVFVRSGGVWSQQALVKASNTGIHDNFGFSVAVSGDTLVVGAVVEDGGGTGVDPVSNDDATDSGAAYIFIRNGTSWSQLAYLKADNAASSDEFGLSVAVAGETAVVGAIFEDGGGGGVDPTSDDTVLNAGAVYLFSAATVPSAPTITGVTPGDGQLSVSFTEAATGGSALTNYEYSTDDGATFTPMAPASVSSPLIITGLTNGTEYTVRIRAVNANGPGTVSDSETATPSTTPEAPTIVSVTPGNGQLTVAFTAGADGGSALTNYEYSIDLGTEFAAVSPASTTSPIVISGLVNGTTYPVRIRAVNLNGASPASLSNTGTPSARPNAPTITGITEGDRQLSVAFTPGAANGSAITNFEYSKDGGLTYAPVAPASTASPIVIKRLTNGTTYVIRIRAVNTSGAGAASTPGSGTPSTTPSAPHITRVTAGDSQLTVAFRAGATGGSPLINYEYSVEESGQRGADDPVFTPVSPASTASPIVITGLTNGTAYKLRIRAVNANGAGAASAPSNGKPKR